MNVRSSKESDFIGVDDVVAKNYMDTKNSEKSRIWSQTKYYISRQYECHEIREERRMSVGKRTRQSDIKYVHITDLIKRKELKIKYCLTN